MSPYYVWAVDKHSKAVPVVIEPMQAALSSCFLHVRQFGVTTAFARVELAVSS